MRASLWFEIFGDLFQCQNPWYMGGKPDNKEWGLNGEPPLHMVLGYNRRSDIKEANITEFRVHIPSTVHS